jgi:hypothetical protein
MQINKHDLFLSIRRTVVPITVGAIGASALAPWLPPALVAEWATLVLASVYYIVLRVLEVKVPGVSVLLGGKGQPHYIDPVEEKRAFEDFLRALKALEDAGEDL